jgi:hypothetical protein
MLLMLLHAINMYIPAPQVVKHGVQTKLSRKYPLLHVHAQFAETVPAPM